LTSIVGIGTSSGFNLGIQTAAYDNITGIITVTTNTVHGFGLERPNTVKLKNLEFSCVGYSGVTTTIFQDHERPLFLVGIVSDRTFKVQAGPSTIVHTYFGGGEAYEFFEDLNFGSGYRGGSVAIGVTDQAYEHRFVSSGIGSIKKTAFSGASSQGFTATNANYVSHTGLLTLTIPNHTFTTSDTVGIDTGGLVFKCSKDNFFSNHPYPRSVSKTSFPNSDPIAGIQTAILATTTDTITINVGQGGGGGTGAVVTATVGAGGTLAFNIVSAGTSYVNPEIIIPQPNYDNLPVIGISRVGLGLTTDTGSNLLVDVKVSAAKTTVGIGSTTFEISEFSIARPGHSFKVGDKFKPIGLVTAAHLSAPIQEFELEVTQIFSDKFSAWQFGELDFIDTIKNLQDGARKRFPLFYNASLLSFEIDPDNPDSSLIDLDSLLLIFVNGVVQEPGKSYIFDGGSSFDFVQAPDANDIIDIFFYKGTDGIDSVQVSAGASITPTIKTGDVVQLNKIGITTGQDPRTIFSILGSDEVETNIYTGLGINESVYKPFNWTKQKIDKKIGGEVVSKVRDSIESQVYPTAKIIDDITTTSDELFLDNAKFFNYEEDYSALTNIVVGGLVVGSTNPVSAAFTATVSIGGTIQALNITNSGSGYVGSTTSISISAPSVIGVGVGVTATATATITNGAITNTTITNPGLGYTISAVPQVLAQLPRPIKEDIDTITTIQGFDGAITGIGVTGGIGHPTALKFNISADLTNNPNSVLTDLKVGYPIYIFGTQVGHGVTSVVSDNSTVVATGTTCVDNIYFINAYNSGVGIITCNIMSGVNTTGIETSGSTIGGFSWGRLTGFTRDANPISIGVTGLTIDSGLTTYPSIQRRDFGLRDSGSLRKDLG